jgi:hypothetical protein
MTTNDQSIQQRKSEHEHDYLFLATIIPKESNFREVATFLES